ncbi:MAG: tetratricopeptide repeat protein [Gemmataceae bacterium]|nr:tetratricopeptide repeat protein [Gemmataceae bacterium]
MSTKSRKERIQEMLQESPEDAELLYMLAMELAGEGDDAGAVRCFGRILALSPNYPPAYHQAGRTLARLGKIEEARAILQQGIPIALKQNDSHAAGEMQGLLETLE